MTAYRTVDVDGVEVFYREAGDPSAQTLLLLHGFPTSSAQYQVLIDHLADRFRLIAPDYPGFGQTEPLDGTTTFDRLAQSSQRAESAATISGCFDATSFPSVRSASRSYSSQGLPRTATSFHWPARTARFPSCSQKRASRSTGLPANAGTRLRPGSGVASAG